ncbi:MAG TPA: extracellular solute-binding protein [Xanthobacteraceae bacterium]|jgi:iron(III) transport system substrate-binding protein
MRAVIWPTLIALTLFGSSALAQDFTPDPVDAAAAKREGSVSWYTSTPVKAAQYIATEFERQTGIKVELLRTGGGEVIRRFQQEAAAGRFAADVITMSDMSAANDLARRGRFAPFRPLGFDKVIADAKDPAGNFIAQRLTMVGILVRTDKVAAADRPTTWSDLTAPKYKGMMVMADPAFTAIQLVVVATLSQKLGWPFYEALRANDTMIVQSHEQIYDTVKRGERLIAAESSDPRIYTGGEIPPNMISVIPRNGAIQVPSPTAIVKGSPHPNAAKLFAQFNLTPEIQHKFTEEGHHSPRVDIASPSGLPRLDELSLYPADYDYIEKNTKQIKAKFADIFQ